MSLKIFLKKTVFIILLFASFSVFFSGRAFSILSENDASFEEYKKERAALEEFINKYFLNDGFFRTNLINSEQRDIASGEDILSESIGLLMLYYLKVNETKKFDNQVNILLKHFINSNQLIKWRIRRGINQEDVNATIDDLRILKALVMASKKWERHDYQTIARRLASQLLKHNVREDYLKAYDGSSSPLAPFVYYDFKAMQLMGIFDTQWSRLAAINLKRVLNKQVEGLPFFRDRGFSEKDGFFTVDNLMVLMHLSEVGIRDARSIHWLKKQLKQEGLFGRYSLDGEPINSVQSPAIYAITALIGRFNNDKELYDLAAERLKSMQNMGKNKYYGGFIEIKQMSAFSFDQLMALLAY